MSDFERSVFRHAEAQDKADRDRTVTDARRARQDQEFQDRPGCEVMAIDGSTDEPVLVNNSPNAIGRRRLHGEVEVHGIFDPEPVPIGGGVWNQTERLSQSVASLPRGKGSLVIND